MTDPHTPDDVPEAVAALDDDEAPDQCCGDYLDLDPLDDDDDEEAAQAEAAGLVDEAPVVLAVELSDGAVLEYIAEEEDPGA